MPIPLDHWENIISAHVNGAPLPTMLDAVRTACIHWCRDTRMIRREVAVTIEPEITAQEIPDVEGLFPSRVIEVWGPSGKLKDASYRELSELYSKGWFNESTASTNELRYWISPQPSSFRLVPKLTVEAEMTVLVAFQPKRNAVEVPTLLYEMFADEIGAGACAILHAHDEAPYADPAKVGTMASIFDAAIKRHTWKSEGGHGQRRRRTTPERP